jgi:hypothetical protein
LFTVAVGGVDVWSYLHVVIVLCWTYQIQERHMSCIPVFQERTQEDMSQNPSGNRPRVSPYDFGTAQPRHHSKNNVMKMDNFVLSDSFISLEREEKKGEKDDGTECIRNIYVYVCIFECCKTRKRVSMEFDSLVDSEHLHRNFLVCNILATLHQEINESKTIPPKSAQRCNSIDWIHNEHEHNCRH